MSNEFPFTGASDEAIASATDETALPLFQEYAWDFVHDKFLYDGNGKHILATGAEAVEMWVYKALKTERYQHLAYSWQYGIEVRQFIGLVMSVGDRYAELKRVIVECLMINPYITSIDSVDFSNDGASVSCSISMTTVYGEVVVNV